MKTKIPQTQQSMNYHYISDLILSAWHGLETHLFEAIGGVVGVFFIAHPTLTVQLLNNWVLDASFAAFVLLIKATIGGFGGIVARVFFKLMKTFLTYIKLKIK